MKENFFNATEAFKRTKIAIEVLKHSQLENIFYEIKEAIDEGKFYVFLPKKMYKENKEFLETRGFSVKEKTRPYYIAGEVKPDVVLEVSWNEVELDNL